MTAKIPIRTVFDGDGNATGLAEFQSGEFVDYSYGGTGLASLGSAGQVLKVNSGGTALEYGSVEAVINIDGATDLTGNTLTATDLLLISDGGTEGRVELGQLDTLFSASTKTLTNKSISLTSNTLSGTTAEFNSALSDGSFATQAGTETLTNKTISGDSNTLSGSFSGITSLTSTTLTDGTATLTSGSLTGIVNITASGTINATTDIQVNGNSVALKPFAIAQAIALG